MQVEQMVAFSGFYRLLALQMSNRLSSLLSLNVDFRDVVCKEAVYGDVVGQVGSFSFSGIFRYYWRGLLVFVSPALVYRLTDRLLGGKGVVAPGHEDIFTCSERFLGERILEFFGDVFQLYSIPIVYERVDSDVASIHYFFMDEAVAVAKLKSKIDGEDSGDMLICHPIQFLEKENFVVKEG